MSKFIKIGVGVVGALVAVGCGQERAPRSFVQPNAIQKSDLDGTWYYAQTVTDAPATSSFMFIGNSSDLMKIRFDIEEDTLFARRSYEQIIGSEDAFTQNPEEYAGQPLAAWKISSQFDIIRQYNSTTGEETNQIIESQERPWNEREYIRVDWSQNLITDYVGLGLNFFFAEGTSVEPVSYWESDPTKPDAFHMERADPSTDTDFQPNEANYFDITNEIVITPNVQTYCYTENGAQSCFTVPVCFLAYKVDDCASQIVKTRNTFTKVATNHDFQPRLWDGIQMNQFGIWDVGLERLTYNRQYGITNEGIIRHAAKFNLWTQSHTVQACKTNTDCTAAGTSCSTADASVTNLYSALGSGATAVAGTGNAGACVDGNNVRQFQTCTTNADCGNATSDPNQSTCDGAALNAPQGGGFCTVPYAKRSLRTIPYYSESSQDEYQVESSNPSTVLTPFPASLWPVGQQVIANWNEAVKTAVADVYGQVPQQDLFVWCHNPVQLLPPGANATSWTGPDGTPANPAACVGNIKPQLDANGNAVLDQYGNQIYIARQGDPRRSTIFWVNQEQNAGPLGYGPPLFDPETGETLSGQAYIYGAALDTYAARSRDLVLLLLGKIDSTSYVLGTNVQNWVQTSRSGVLDMQPTYSKDDVKRRYAAMDYSWARGLAPAARLDVSSMASFVNSLNNREAAIYESGIFGNSNADLSTERRSRLMDSPLEAMMITPDVIDMGGAQPGSTWDTLSDGEKMRTSPLRSSVVLTAQQQQQDLMRTLGVDFDEFADEGMVQRALQLANDPNIPNLAPEAILQQLTKDIFLGVTLHEVGHNMGLRHNFRASFDSMNYFPEYWQLRQAAANNPSALKYVGLDPTTGQPLQTGTYQGTDCAANQGKIRARYIDCPGGATSVNEVMGVVEQGQPALAGGVREFQYTSIMDYGAEFNSDLQKLGHYDKAAMKFSYAGNGYVEVFSNSLPLSSSPDVFTTAGNTWTAIHTFQTGFGAPSPLGVVGSGLSAVTYGTYPTLFQNGAPDLEVRKDVPYSQIQDLGSPPDPTNPGNGTHLYVYSDPSGAQFPMVPYFFCSDEFVGNLTCQRFDSGADAFEQAQDLISRYNNFYLLNDFKRDRFTFYSSLAYQSRIEGRYLDMLREQLTWYSLFRSDFEQFLFEQAGSGTDPEAELNNFFTDDVNGWGNFTIAVTNGFDLLGNIIATPNAGQYLQIPGNYTTTTDASHPLYQQFTDSLIPESGAVSVGLFAGKYINTTWDFSGCGYYWADECETRIGFFRDKVFALDELTQSQAYFTGRDTSTDVRTYAIGYITPFRAQIEEKIGALLATDYSSLAPALGSGGAAAGPVLDSWTLDNSGQGKNLNALIDPSAGFTLQLYAGVYGLSAFPTTFDQSFIQTTKIFEVGNGEAPVPDTELMNPDQAGSIATTNPAKLLSNGGTAQYFVWNDVDFGTTYAALSIPPAKINQGTTSLSVRNDTGARMLELGASIQQTEISACNLPNGPPTDVPTCEAKQIALQNVRENIQVMRSLHNAYGYGVYKTDAPFYY